MVDLVRSAVLIPVPDCRRTWFTRFFFFQAEDGIRDYKVTGVQTCALPISASGTISAANGGTVNLSYSYLGPLILPITVKATLTIPPGAVAQNTTITMTMDRSEERRVGKGVDLGGRRIIKKKNKRSNARLQQ